MTNIEILQGECLLRNIQEEVNTFQAWRAKGFKVKKGEKALFETKLWKKTKGKVEVEENDSEEDKKKKYSGFYLAKSYMFGEHQVEKIGGNKDED